MRGHIRSRFQHHLGCIPLQAGAHGVIGQQAENGFLQYSFGPGITADMVTNAGLAGTACIVPGPGSGASRTQRLREADTTQSWSETRFGKQRDGRAGFTRQLILVIPAG
ncbi:hypothetical protein [Mesorhizobium sp. M1396]|uniref:hypothetical protein n=1 Tax=Mesorhizobium sp. M1396 TaxID=2957095 RepID=UPI00333A18F4